MSDAKVGHGTSAGARLGRMRRATKPTLINERTLELNLTDKRLLELAAREAAQWQVSVRTGQTAALRQNAVQARTSGPESTLSGLSEADRAMVHALLYGEV